MTLSGHEIVRTRLCAKRDCALEAMRDGDFCAEHAPTPSLQDLVEFFIRRGEHDPHVICEKIESRLGGKLMVAARPYVSDLIVELARHRMATLRRRAVKALRETGDSSLETKSRAICDFSGA